MINLVRLVVIGSLIIWNNAARVIREGPKNEERSQFGYSTSIIHYTPGDDQSKHAQSEINVNMDHQPDTVQRIPSDNRIRSSTKSPEYTTKSSLSYHSYEKSPRYQVYQPAQYEQTQSAVHVFQAPKLIQQSQIKEEAGQSSFNVGYSIGFGESANKEKYKRPKPISTEIITGIGKVSKPSDHQPKDYVLHAVEDYQKQGLQLSFPKSKPQKEEIIDSNYNIPQYAQLIAAPAPSYQTYATKPTLHHKNQHVPQTIPIYQPNDEDSFGWKTITPNLEVASSNNQTPRKNSGRHHIQKPTYHIIKTKFPAEDSVEEKNYQQKSQYAEQHEAETPHTFDHAQAIGHSLGFDYSNAVNIAGDYSASGSSIHASSTPRYMNDPTPTSYQNGPMQIDKTLLENFYKQYKPVSLNWFQNHDALPNQETKDNSDTEQNNNPRPIYAMDTRLLQSLPPSSSNNYPFPIDTTLLQKVFSSHSSQPNSNQQSPIYTQQTESNNEVDQRPKEYTEYSPQNGHQFPPELFSKKEETPKHYHHVMSHEQRNHHERPAERNPERTHERHAERTHERKHERTHERSHQKSNHRLYHEDSSALDQHGSHSSQVNNVVPYEEIIKGKPKKPGVVRHPRLLHSNDNSGPRHILPSQPTSLQYYGLDTALRPPPINYVLPKNE